MSAHKMLVSNIDPACLCLSVVFLAAFALRRSRTDHRRYLREGCIAAAIVSVKLAVSAGAPAVPG